MRSRRGEILVMTLPCLFLDHVVDPPPLVCPGKTASRGTLSPFRPVGGFASLARGSAGTGSSAPGPSDCAPGEEGDAPSNRAAGPVRNADGAPPRREWPEEGPWRGLRLGIVFPDNALFVGGVTPGRENARTFSLTTRYALFVFLTARYSLMAVVSAEEAGPAAARRSATTSAAPAVPAAAAWPRRKRWPGPPRPSAARCSPAGDSTRSRG